MCVCTASRSTHLSPCHEPVATPGPRARASPTQASVPTPKPLYGTSHHDCSLHYWRPIQVRYERDKFRRATWSVYCSRITLLEARPGGGHITLAARERRSIATARQHRPGPSVPGCLSVSAARTLWFGRFELSRRPFKWGLGYNWLQYPPNTEDYISHLYP